MRILVVDDEELIRWSIQRMLTRLDYDVDGAENLKIAEALLRKRRYDLVLCDFMMPEGCGDRLLAEVRKTYPDTRCVVMSGDLSQPGIHDIDADAFLEKPFLKKELLDVIRKALSGVLDIDT